MFPFLSGADGVVLVKDAKPAYRHSRSAPNQTHRFCKPDLVAPSINILFWTNARKNLACYRCALRSSIRWLHVFDQHHLVCAAKEREHFIDGAATPPLLRRGVALACRSQTETDPRGFGIVGVIERPYNSPLFPIASPNSFNMFSVCVPCQYTRAQEGQTAKFCWVR
jgi:hypothetical protein